MGPEDQHPWDAQDEEIAKAFADKDKEIRRLQTRIAELCDALATMNSEIKRLKERIAMDAESQHVEELKALITELCEALEQIPIGLTPPDRELVQRAREVTK